MRDRGSGLELDEGLCGSTSGVGRGRIRRRKRRIDNNRELEEIWGRDEFGAVCAVIVDDLLQKYPPESGSFKI